MTMSGSDPQQHAQQPNAACLRVEDWPDPDREAWATAIHGGDFLEEGGPASHWSPASLRKTASGFGHYLAWLQDRGRLDPASLPADRVTKEQVSAYVEDLSARNRGYTILCRIQELYDAIRVMAPDRDWAWLRRIGSAIRSRTKPAKSKEGRVQTPGRLANLGLELMARADAATDQTPLQRAVLFRDGLMIALLAYRPALRISNLAAMAIGHHLVQQGSAYWLHFEAEEMKGRRMFEATVPADVRPGLDRYIQHYRVILLTGANRRPAAKTDALWVSETATPMAVISIHNRFRTHTRAAFGVAVPPHLFRDSAATAIATEGPDRVRTIMPVLGHSRLATSEIHYNHARSLDASRKYIKIIAGLKRRLEES
jgi:site-specific recombinase XerD